MGRMEVVSGGVTMNDTIDAVELAHELAEIARTTTDADTGRRLIEVVERLLVAAGLPLDDGEGGGELPTDGVSHPANCPEYA